MQSRGIVLFSEAAGSPAAGEGVIRVSYNGILKQLPPELHGKISPPSSAKFAISSSQVLEQLPQGAVKINFGELRKAAPLGIFKNNSDQDARMVDLPLREILPQVKPDSYARRSQQQRHEMPEEISDLFGRKGELLARLRVLQKDELLKPAPSEPKPAAPVQPAAPGSVPGARLSFARRAGIPVPDSLPKPKAAPAPAVTAPTPAVTPTMPRMSYPGESLVIPVAELSKYWPEAVNREIVQLNLTAAQCHLPMTHIGRAVTNGVVQLSWAQVRSWIRPPPPQGASSTNADATLEIPLKVIASLTLTHGQSSAPSAAKKEAGLVPGPVSVDQAGVGFGAVPLPKAKGGSGPVAVEKPELVCGAGGKEILRLPVAMLAKQWPEVLRRQIMVSAMAKGVVELPREAVEPGLKTGKIEFSWKQIQEWLKPPVSEGVGSAFDETALELPLPMLVPLLFSSQAAAAPKRSSPADDIPDLFNPAGKGQTASEPEAEKNVEGATARPERSEAVTEPAKPSQPVPQALENEPKDLAELFEEPDKRNWTPNEIVHKTTLLPDVRGALIALQDGLLVASCMPPEWKTETIAAFLPQIFGRMNQYAKELKMGELNSVSFTVDQGTLQIYNAGIIYFAALGQPGRGLPASLNLIARELSRHTR